MRSVVVQILSGFATLAVFGVLFAQTTVRSHGPAQNRITRSIEESRQVRLRGNLHPLASKARRTGVPRRETTLDSMILMLRPSTSQEQEMEALSKAQQDPASPEYHRWITPSEYGRRFGATDDDIAKITEWLSSKGFTIERIPESRNAIIFNGTIDAVEKTFDVQMALLDVNGAVHMTNTLDPQIPEALAEVVGGVVSFNDFQTVPMHTRPEPLGVNSVPQFTSGSYHYMAPADFSTIYNSAALFSEGNIGAGQTIAVIGRTQMRPTDVTSFRSQFGLTANAPVVVLNGADPGIVDDNELFEASLDVQWAGAAAPGATIKFVVSKSTQFSDGVYLSSQYAVDNAVGSIMTISFGLCEASAGSSATNYFHNLWRQAALQGITVLVSSGDSGAAGCDGSSANSGTHGRGVNALCSSPYSVCVGGTEFADAATPGQYWSPSTDPTTKKSVLSYIPEAAWNDSDTGGLWSTGGGVSLYFDRPAWQTGVGEPAGQYRLVPDVSLNASGHDGYLVVINGSLHVAAGTSASSPALAGLMALVNAKNQSNSGNANTRFYPLAAWQFSSGGPSIFHDVTSGSNTVPGVTGFDAGSRYDLATGLGSVDAYELASHWLDTPSQSGTVTASFSASTLTVRLGASGTSTFQLTSGTGADCAFGITPGSLPTGLTVSGTGSSDLCAPGSRTLTFSAASGMTPGTYTISFTAANASVSSNTSIDVTVNGSPTYSVVASPSSVTLARTLNTNVSLSVSALYGFSSAIQVTVARVPAGVTATLSPSSLGAPGNGTIRLNLAATATASMGSLEVQLSFVGGTNRQTVSIPLTITGVPGCTLAAEPTSVAIPAGKSGTTTISCGNVVSSFSTAVSLSLSGAPSGVTASLSPGSVSPGQSTSTLTLKIPETATTGRFSLTLTGKGGAFSRTLTIPLTIKAPDIFRIMPTAPSVTLAQGSTGSVNLTTQLSGDFNADVDWSVSGLPSGVSATFTPSTMDAPGNGTTSLQLTAALSAPVRTATATVTAKGGGVTRSVPLTVNVLIAPTFTISPNSLRLTVNQGSFGTTTLQTAIVGTFKNDVNLSATLADSNPLPDGLTLTMPSAIRSPGAGTATIKAQVTTDLPVGSYSLLIRAQGGSVTKQVPFALTVLPPLDFTFRSSASTLEFYAGSTATSTLTIAGQYGFASNLSLSFDGMGSGLTGSFSTTSIPSAKGTSVVTIKSNASISAGSYTARVRATGGGLSKSVDITVNVRSLSISAADTAPTVNRGGYKDVEITVAASSGQASIPIQLSAINLPTGVTASWSPASSSSGFTSRLRLTAASTAPTGTRTVTLRATASASTRDTTISVKVQ